MIPVKRHPVLGYWVRKDGSVYAPGRRGKFRWTKGTRVATGYYMITCKNRTFFVHRLVYETFKGTIPPGRMIDHINRKRDDNRIANLRAVTCSENLRNSARHDRKVIKDLARRVRQLELQLQSRRPQ